MSEGLNAADQKAEGVATARMGTERFATEITCASGHAITVDQAQWAGGTGTAPCPVDLLAAAIASCKLHTMARMADRNRWPMTGAAVTAKHERVKAEEIDPDAERGFADIFECEIEIHGDELTDDQRRKLYHAADRCLVQHALEHESRFRSKLIERG